MRNRSGRFFTIPFLVFGLLFAPGPGGGLRAEAVGSGSPGDGNGGTGSQWVEEREFPPESRCNLTTVLLLPFRIPEFILSIPAWPILKFLEYEEEYAVVQRTYDFFSNDDHTVLYFPYFYYSPGDKFVFGATYTDTDVFDRARKFSLSADLSTDGGRSASASFTRPGDAVSPLSYSFNAGYGKNLREKFYGFGNETDRESASVFQEESVGVALDIGRKIRALPFLTPILRLGFVSEKTGESTKPGGSDSMEDNFDPETLTGFGETMDLFQYGLTLRYDRRIPFYEPYRGQKVELSILKADSLGGSPYGYTTFHLGFTQLINLYRDNRIITVGFQFETTEGFGDEVPFNHMSNLGTNSPLRGFPGGRFSDIGYLLFNIEYSYPVWRTKSPGNVSMLGTFFFDTGKTFSEFSEIDEGKVHYSGGTGLAVSFPGEFYLRQQVAYGGEGIQFVVAFNRSF